MHQYSIQEIADALKKKSMSSEEVTRHFINRIELHDPSINAVTHLCHEESIKQAKAIDAMRAQDANSLGELAGVPLLVKDNFCTRHADNLRIKGTGRLHLTIRCNHHQQLQKSRHGDPR